MRKSAFILLAGFLAGVLLLPFAAYGVTAVPLLYVDHSVVESGNGQSWETAMKTIQEALDEAASLGTPEVWVKAGTYSESITLEDGVALYGGFIGGETERNQRDWITYETTIDGQEEVHHVVIGADNTTIDGFTITGGDAGEGNGGGMLNDGVSPTVVNCTFKENSANDGAGMYNDNSSPTITNSTFTKNLANDDGGGMYNYNSSSPTITNSTFSENYAKYWGGAIYNDDSSLTITNTTFSENHILYYYGGAIYNDDSSLTITNSTFSENYAEEYDGGAIYNDNDSSLTITSSTFSENWADEDGGAIYNDDSSLTITNSIFTENSANDDGGGIYNSNSSPTLINCTFSGNSAVEKGGGFYNGLGSDPMISNCIFWGDQAKYDPEIYDYPSDTNSPVVSYSDVEGGYDGTEIINDNPLFVDVTDLDPANWDLHLQADSPCIDQIPTDSGDLVDIDFHGYLRPRDAGYDMGAYEFVSDITQGYSLPGGSGDVTDYRIFTVPVELGTGSALKAQMEVALGTYDKGLWRVFAWDSASSSYIEMDDPAFAAFPVYPGMAFWIISTGTDTISFSGQPAPDGAYLKIPLSPGWNMFALPWPATSIELGNIAVSDGINNYWITSGSNSLTQQYVWEYTGTGPGSGYEQVTSGPLQIGKGYWIKVDADFAVELLIPKDNSEGYFEALSYIGVSRSSTSTDSDEEPPAPPEVGTSYDPGSSGGTAGSGGGGCFISTAAGGSGLLPFLLPLIGFGAFILFANPIFRFIGFIGFVGLKR